MAGAAATPIFSDNQTAATPRHPTTKSQRSHEADEERKSFFPRSGDPRAR
jgi:hypothetical protein